MGWLGGYGAGTISATFLDSVNCYNYSVECCLSAYWMLLMMWTVDGASLC